MGALKRLHDWAAATGIRFVASPCRAGWQQLGLPDLRGFTPHLRTVRRFAGEPAQFPRAEAVARGGPIGFDDLEVPELWLLHDLAHVIWYDVASVSFGDAKPTTLWRERDFFVEHHLASEAFAVLLLDYHLLSRTRHRGLAVDLDADAWERLRASEPRLPPLDSRAMADALLEQYLTGAGELFARRSPALASWRDHEVSYSDKQRWYVLLWWNDLIGKARPDEQAVVEESQVGELLWLMLRLFTTAGEEEFRGQVEALAPRLRKIGNCFAALPKCNVPRARPDFRFTDVSSIAPEQAATLVREAEVPRAETLFLLWQLLSRTPPQALAAEERAAVEMLANSVQTAHPDAAAWRSVRKLAQRIVVEERWNPDPLCRAAFFLP